MIILSIVYCLYKNLMFMREMRNRELCFFFFSRQDKNMLCLYPLASTSELCAIFEGLNSPLTSVDSTGY